MFKCVRERICNYALGKVKEKLMNPVLEGIGVVKEISWRDGSLFLTLVLEGLEDRPIDVRCSEIEIAPDGSALTIHKFESNMPFAQTALNRFGTRAIEIPEGNARFAVVTAKKTLGL